MKKGIGASVRATSSFLVIASLLAGPIASAQDCSSQSSDLVSRISALKSRADDENGKMKSDFSSATSSSYRDAYFKKFDSWNSGVTEASKLVTKGYDLAGYTGVMKEGQKQTKMPPTVTNTMTNAIDLAEAAADEDNSKLDLAELRCNQSTEDTALESFLKQADSGTVSTFKSAKYNLCRIVSVLSDLQDKKRKLDEIRKNGYPLFFLHVKEKKTFASTYERTIQFKLDLRLFPIYPDTASINGGDQKILLGQLESIKLSYNTYYKWSDDNWEPLNLYQYLISDTDNSGGICAPAIKLTDSVKAELCIEVKDITDSSIKLKTFAKFHYKGDNKSASLGDVTIPAPFGYLEDVSDMKESKMQDLKSKLVDRLASVFGDFGDLADKAKEWQGKCT